MFENLNNAEATMKEFKEMLKKAEDIKEDIDAYCEFKKEVILRLSSLN